MSQGEVLRRWRKAKDWNQSDLAERSGVSRDTIWRAETDQNTSIEKLDRVVRALGQSLEQLYAETGRIAGPPLSRGSSIPTSSEAPMDERQVRDEFESILRFLSRVPSPQRETWIAHLLNELAEWHYARRTEQRGGKPRRTT